MTVSSGLDVLAASDTAREQVVGNIAYLCHSASVDRSLNFGAAVMKNLFGDRLVKLFSPQHGLFTDVQDNMIETDHSHHPYFDLPIFSLYSETREPTEEMLADVDTVVIDLQDIGTRIYTYIYTMTLMMAQCGKRDIRVVVLDRPNPIGGTQVEGPILDPAYASFVGRHPLPVRHGMTIGEIAMMANHYFDCECDLHVIAMDGWQRNMAFEDTGLPWVMPSPNIPTVDSAYAFVGAVIYEGTNISEGRGTTRPFEIFGHPGIHPYELEQSIVHALDEAAIDGFKLRALNFQPTFNKHAGTSCGGYQVHITDRVLFPSWRFGQIMLREFVQTLGDAFQWKEPPYEYEYDRQPIDLINGGTALRQWVENDGTIDDLLMLERHNRDAFLEQRAQCLLYTN